MTNLNTTDYLDKVKNRLYENLRMLPHAPGVQVQAIPDDSVSMEVDEANEDLEADENKDVRLTKTDKDKRIMADNEYSDSEDEGPSGDDRRNNESHKNKKSKSNDAKAEINATEDTNGNKVEKTSSEVDEKKSAVNDEEEEEDVKTEEDEEKVTSSDVEMKDNGNDSATEKKEEDINEALPAEA